MVVLIWQMSKLRLREVRQQSELVAGLGLEPGVQSPVHYFLISRLL